MKQKILDYTRNNKHIVLWAVISFSVIFLFTFFVYINNHARDGIYPEDQFGTLKEFKKHLNPYLNIYNIKQEKNSNNESQNNSVQTGFGFMATDNPKGGAVVVKVYPDSTSFKSGLREGDVITNANDTSVLKDYDLGQVIYNKEFIKLKVNRGGKTLDMSMHKGSFMETEGFKVGSTKTVSKDENIPDSNILDQANYGLNKMKEGTVEYSVEGISFFGAFIIAFLWGLSILPVLILGMFFYKKIINIRHKIFIILLNLISIPIIMSLVMFFLYISGFFDEMVRGSIHEPGGFINLDILIYPFAVIIFSLFLIIGYTITLFVYKRYINKLSSPQSI